MLNLGSPRCEASYDNPQQCRTMNAPESPEALVARIRALRQERAQRKDDTRGQKPVRQSLSPAERDAVLAKTDARCHICGGEIDPQETWNADHVLAHSGGGEHHLDNYLPAHGTCNNYRWDYLGEEMQYILKLGVWLRTQIEKETPAGPRRRCQIHKVRTAAGRPTQVTIANCADLGSSTRRL